MRTSRINGECCDESLIEEQGKVLGNITIINVEENRESMLTIKTSKVEWTFKKMKIMKVVSSNGIRFGDA